MKLFSNTHSLVSTCSANLIKNVSCTKGEKVIFRINDDKYGLSKKFRYIYNLIVKYSNDNNRYRIHLKKMEAWFAQIIIPLRLDNEKNIDNPIRNSVNLLNNFLLSFPRSYDTTQEFFLSICNHFSLALKIPPFLVRYGHKSPYIKKTRLSEESFNLLITRTRKYMQKGLAKESKSFTETLELFQRNIYEIGDTMEKLFGGNTRLSALDPTKLFYFLEREDEMKNPSWKRRIHRFHCGIDLPLINHLSAAIQYAEMSYLDNIQDIQKLLRQYDHNYELIYFQMNSYPGEPSHYIAIKRGYHSKYEDKSASKGDSTALSVLLVVRGTKSIPDMLTDALMDAKDYRGGMVHAGIVRSGKFLFHKHMNLLKKIYADSGKERIKLDIIGHSLGAGAGTIAGIEFNYVPYLDVSVIGFGCPALLSSDISIKIESFVTTVIADADIMPRMSAATLSNIVLDILECDWTNYARRDIEQALQELRSKFPSFLPKEVDNTHIMAYINMALDHFIKKKIKSKTTKRAVPLLFPPGTCVHLYRDGVSITGCFVPCTFFKEIDICRTMVNDHLLDKGYRQIFYEVIRNHQMDNKGSFYRRFFNQ